MPRDQYEALKQCRQARCDRGKDIDKLTVCDEDEDKDGKDDLQEEAAPLKARIHMTTTDIVKRVLLFSQGAPGALYNDQMIITLDVL